MKVTTKLLIEPVSERECFQMKFFNFCCADYQNITIADANDLMSCPIDYFSQHGKLISVFIMKLRYLEKVYSMQFQIPKPILHLHKLSLISHIAMKRQLDELVSIFLVNKIPVILLKGAAFMCSMYSKEYPRPASDIDVLVRNQDWERANEILNENFSTKHLGRGPLSGIYETSFQPKDNTGFHIDLHKSISHPYIFVIAEDDLWGNSELHPIYKDNLIRVLNKEMAFVHQTIHSIKDLDGFRYSLLDSTNLIRSDDFAFTKLTEISEKIGLAFSVSIYLDFLVSILGQKCTTKLNCNESFVRNVLEVNKRIGFWFLLNSKYESRFKKKILQFTAYLFFSRNPVGCLKLINHYFKNFVAKTVQKYQRTNTEL